MFDTCYIFVKDLWIKKEKKIVSCKLNYNCTASIQVLPSHLEMVVVFNISVYIRKSYKDRLQIGYKETKSVSIQIDRRSEGGCVSCF